MADRAFHVVASATQVGLTQVLGPLGDISDTDISHPRITGTWGMRLAATWCCDVARADGWSDQSPSRLVLGSTPGPGWLVESERNQATGFVSFTKWGAGNVRYKQQTYFQVKDKWEPEAVYIGRFENKNGFTEFCAVNPEHGGFEDGDTFVITNSYDYCARLTRE